MGALSKREKENGRLCEDSLIEQERRRWWPKIIIIKLKLPKSHVELCNTTKLFSSMACNYIVCAIVSIMCIVLQRQRNLFYIRWPATLFTIFWHFIHKWHFSSKITIRGFDPTGVLGCSAAPLLCTFLVPSIYIWGVLLEKIREDVKNLRLV